MNRRDFVSNLAITGSSAMIAGQKTARGAEASANAAMPAAQSSAREWTVAGLQILDSKDVPTNERVIHAAIDRAAAAKADFLITPEGSLSGYHPAFDRVQVAEAIARVTSHAKDVRLGLVLGTCFKDLEEEWPEVVATEVGAKHKQREYCYDQIRVYAPTGEYLGAHSKILLCSPIFHPGTGEVSQYVTGTLRTFTWDGVCFGALICNDLWATPGATTTPNPYLPWRLKTMGAQVIFHSVGTAGTPEFYRTYQEANQSLWAKVLRVPIVTTNANDGKIPSNCRAGFVDASGERHNLAPDLGEQFFVSKVSIPASTA